jgi:hypothetical protein
VVPLLHAGSGAWPDRTLFAHVQRREIPPKWERSAVMTERWRLINGSELYDLQQDPGQARDLAADNPATVAQLRDRYETWWASLAPALGRHALLLVGSEVENPSVINCMDWHNDDVRSIPWNQAQVKDAPWANGYWMIEVVRPGRYEFTLRQQPPAADFALQATRARIAVGDQEAAVGIAAGATHASLTLSLPAGPAKLQTWLIDGPSGKSRGAFFVSVRRLE